MHGESFAHHLRSRAKPGTAAPALVLDLRCHLTYRGYILARVTAATSPLNLGP